MTSAIPAVPSDSLNSPTPIATTAPTAPGVVPAQLPARSYASATTATPITSTPAGASSAAQNAKPASESPVNGTNAMAQGGPQPGNTVPNGTPSSAEHGRKPSVVINATGASGYTPNGGPVSATGRAPNISFGSMNQSSPMPTASAPYQSQTSSLATPQGNPRTTTPTHSPSPIPQPPASGGRPPSSLQNQSNGMQFGSMGGDSDQARQNQMPPVGPGMQSMHERRASSHSYGNNFVPQNGRGRGYPGQPPFNMPSPGPNFRPNPATQNRPQSMQQPYPGAMPPGSPYNRGRNSPALTPGQPNMQQQHMGGNQQMPYGYNPNMGPQGYQYPGMGQPPPFDPNSGYYHPYWAQQGYPQPQPSPGPRGYPPYPTPPHQMGAAPFYPGAQSMSRSTSQASERPQSALGQPSTPSLPHAPPTSQTPVSGQQSAPTTQANQFVRPTKTSKAIVIKDASGNPININKSSPAPTATAPTAPADKPSGPVIVSTPGIASNTSTPPPRVPSSQHNRTESKSTKTAEETKKEFQEQVRRTRELKEKTDSEAAKPTEDAAAPSSQPEDDSAAKDVVKEATAEAEKAAAVAAGDKAGAEAADAALSAVQKEDGEKTEQEETEEERMEREIAEMEAAEREEEEREKAFQEKRKKEKEAAAGKEAEEQAKRDEELKRQEREAEEREEQRERERAGTDKGGDDTDDQAKDMFAALKKPTLGPGASTPGSGAETPASEEAEPSPMLPPTQPASGSLARPAGVTAGKPKPAHLKLETTKRVEPAEPTPGMQALKSARFLTIKEEAKYPDGFKSPNPALNVNGTRKGKAYDKDFLLQFQKVFNEKPSVDWDQKVRETLGPGDEPGSARPGSARTPSSNMGRSASGRPGQPPMQNFGGAMGQFGGLPNRTLPPGTTSAQRFEASQQPGRPGMGAMPMGGRPPSQFGMPQPIGMSRTNSLQTMGNLGGPGSPRQPSSRGGKGGSRRGDRTMSKKEEAEMAAKMPLTAHMEIKSLEKSTTGWKASSLAGPAQPEHDVSGNLTPDVVQRKVKAALNKMTPDNFDRISNQILEIAAQSKNETDGRTLRQVIQLTFEKATDESHWAGMYARFCLKMLTAMSPEIRDETIKDKNGNAVVGGALFRKYLLNRCQEDFEQGWQANLPPQPEGETGEAKLLSDEYYTAAAAKRRGLGLIQFIGQLYILRMLTIKIMHQCVMRLLNFEGEPDEAAVENLTTLLRSVGGAMEDEDKGNDMMNIYFDRIESAILKSETLSSRPKFMIMDLIDLRKAGWKGKDDNKGPKTIQQIHEEAEAAAARAEAERQRTAQRGGPGGRPPAGRGDARQFSGGMPPPPQDFNRIQTDDLRRLQNRNASARAAGGGLGPGGNLGPGSLLSGARSGSRRGAGGNLGPSSSGNTTRTNTPPVGDKKEEAPSQNAFNALAALDPEAHDNDAASVSEAASPPTRAKSPLAATEKTEETSTA